MTNHTPDLSKLRDAYIAAMMLMNAMRGKGDDIAKSGEEFDRGISKVKADVWDEAIREAQEQGTIQIPDNPYRQEDER